MATRELKVEIVGDASSLSRAFGKASKDTSALGKGFTTLAKAAAVAGAAVAVAAGVGLKKSIDAASNLEEQINKTNVVFRGSQEQVKQWSTGLAQSFGLSQRAALEAAGTYGNMLVPMGIARDKAAQMSEAMVELAGDMASFNNASPADTLAAIQSGLAGQARPLRQYGVFLSAARTEQEALTETGKKNAKQLTEGEKALARYNLILKDTKDTQSDFVRSSGSSLENQLRIMRAEFENLAASIGKVVLPIVIKLMGFINRTLIPGLSNAGKVLTDWFKNLQGALSKAPNFKAKLNIVVENTAALAKRFINSVVSEIESLLPQKPVVFNPRLEARGLGTTGGGVDWNKVAADMVAALAVALEQSTKIAQALSDTISKAVDQIDWAAVGASMGPGLAQAMATAVQTALDPAFWAKNWDLVLSIALVAFGGPISKFAGKAVEIFAARFGPGIASLGGKLGAAFVGLVARISPEFVAAMGRLMDDAIKILSNVLSRVWPVFVALATRLWRQFENQMSGLMRAIFGRLAKLAVFTLKVLGVDAAIHAVVNFAHTVANWLQKVIDWFTKLPGRITAALGNLGSLLYSAGAALVQGLWDGAKSKAAGLLSWLGGLASKVKSVVTLGLHGSPELFTYYLGGQTMEAWARGVKEKQDKVIQAHKEAVQKAKQAVLDARSSLVSAFTSLADAALSAFDAAVSAWVPPSQKILDKMRLQDAKKQIEGAVKDANQAIIDAQTQGAKDVQSAQDALTKAIAGGDPEEIAQAQQGVLTAQANAAKAYSDAQDQYAEALRARKEYYLELDAQQEQAAHDKKMARQRIHLKNELDQIGEWLSKHPGKYKEAYAKVADVLKDAGVNAKTWGTAIGIALAQGLRDAEKEVSAAAGVLARAIERKLKTKSPTEEGPMSDLDTWWSGLAPSLIKGIDFGQVSQAGEALASTLKRGVAITPPTLAGMGAVTSSSSAALASSAYLAEITVPVYLNSSLIAEEVRREYLRFEKRNGRSAI